MSATSAMNTENQQMYNEVIITSDSDSYQVLEFLGSGSFGQVVKCWKQFTNEIVALKILKNDPRYEKYGYREAEILTIINEVDIEQFGFVRLVESFKCRNHICIVFECLNQSMYDFLLYNNLSATQLSKILKQLLLSLSKLKELGVIHTDLKPANIMVIDPTCPPYRVKVIDFGSARKIDQAVCNDDIQTLWYRSPEVLLGLPYGVEVDMWSLGCIAAELILRRPLFPGSHEYDQIRYICDMVGAPPTQMLDDGVNTGKYFKPEMDDDVWQLKTVQRYEFQTGKKCYETRKYVQHFLDDIIKVNLPSHLRGDDLMREVSGRKFIVDLIKQMLEVDPKVRITPEEALDHPAIHVNFENL